ncbi:MAG: hypothetical protein LBI72_00260 [Flavobacteriaceae bacterium]|jgi:hypothetical protein|nr:hypothetical protein [Flavobacteriaceae bacterium]
MVSTRFFLQGGWYIKNLEELGIELIDLETNENINLKFKNFYGLRRQDYIHRQKAVQAFEFNILKSSKLKITINNPESLIMKRSHPIILIHSFLFPKKIELDLIKVVIK